MVLQNLWTLDLLTAGQSGTCLYLKEECCFYYNQSGRVEEDIKGLLEQATEILDMSSTGVCSSSSFPSWLLPFLGPAITILLGLLLGPCILQLLTKFISQQVPTVPNQSDVTTRVSDTERLLLCWAGLRPCTAGKSYRRKRPLPQLPRSILSLKSLRGELLGDAR